MTDHVEVLGSGSASAAPDCAVVQARIQSTGDSVGAALDALARSMTAAMAQAADSGVDERERRTAALGVNQRYDAQGQHVVGYTAYQSVTLTLRDRDATGPLITALARAVGDDLSIDNVRLRVHDTSVLARKARELAMADALDQARHLAHLAGRQIGPVLAVLLPDDSAPAASAKFGRSLASDSGAMPIEGGESSVNVSLRVQVALRD